MVSHQAVPPHFTTKLRPWLNLIAQVQFSNLWRDTIIFAVDYWKLCYRLLELCSTSLWDCYCLWWGKQGFRWVISLPICRFWFWRGVKQSTSELIDLHTIWKPSSKTMSRSNQSRHRGVALVGLASQTKLQDPQIEKWNTINEQNFFKL